MNRLLGYIWAMPATIIGMVLALFYLPRSIHWSDGCLELTVRWMIGNPDAQTWGFLIFYKNQRMREVSSLRVHERVHVRQGMRWGPLFLVAYGVEWVYRYATETPQPTVPQWFVAYWRLSWEKEARGVEEDFRKGRTPDTWGSGDV